MIKLAANISHLWAELPWLDRIEAAAEAGFDGVEALFPYDAPIPETQEALARLDMQFVLLNAPPPNYTGGARGFAAQPAARTRFAHDMRRALRYAKSLKARFVHVMTGEAKGSEARACLVDNLRAACALAPEPVTITLEPLNGNDIPGYFLGDYDLAAEIIEEVGAPNIGLQFDTYHAQTIGGDAVATFERHAGLVRHIQIGDAPGRGAPGNGRVNFAALFAAVEQAGYDGWISAEYTPAGPTEKSLGWMGQLRA